MTEIHDLAPSPVPPASAVDGPVRDYLQHLDQKVEVIRRGIVAALETIRDDTEAAKESPLTPAQKERVREIVRQEIAAALTCDPILSRPVSPDEVE